MSEVQVEISEGIATMTFNRPHSLNAITPDGLFSFIVTFMARISYRIEMQAIMRLQKPSGTLTKEMT
jgi:1,4-dihydroxy-2-naphthoyl-CoA synthase